MCFFIFYAIIKHDCSLKSDNSAVKITASGTIVENGMEKDRYHNYYTGKGKNVSVTFTVTCADSTKKFVVLMTADCFGNGGAINISFNSVCPNNAKCTQDDDRKMVKERSTIINKASAEIGVQPTSSGWDDVKLDDDEAYCTKCADTPQIIDFSSNRPKAEPLVPECDPLTERCNHFIYKHAGAGSYFNSFYNEASIYLENSWLSQAIGEIKAVLDDKCGYCNMFRSYDPDYYGIDALKPVTSTTLPAIRSRLLSIGGIEGYYTNLDATFNAIIAGACVGAAVIIAVIVLVVMRIRKAKKVNVVARTSDNVQMKQYVM